MKLSKLSKILLVVCMFGVAIAGFLIKLPYAFHQVDKGLHTLFYFLAAAFLNIIFGVKKLLTHCFIFIFLYCFGIAIEYAQEYSNKLMHKRIHGRFDPEDVEAKLKRLLLFSAVWVVIAGIMFLYRVIKQESAKDSLN